MSRPRGWTVQIKGFLGWYDHASFRHKERARSAAEQKRKQGYEARVIKKPVHPKHLLGGLF